METVGVFTGAFVGIAGLLFLLLAVIVVLCGGDPLGKLICILLGAALFLLALYILASSYDLIAIVSQMLVGVC